MPWKPMGHRQKSRESLREYIRRFSKECNIVPNVAGADIIGVFLSGATCESPVHKLGRKGSRTTKELLDITTNHASGEEAMGAIFDRTRGVKEKLDEAADEGPSDRPGKKKNKKKGRGHFTAAVDRNTPACETPEFF